MNHQTDTGRLPMHELSIATSLAEIVAAHARDHGAETVRSITLRVGALSCVHKRALEFSFELVTKETPLEDAQLRFIDIPVAIFCGTCNRTVELPGIQRFRCPVCDTPSGDIRQGKELDVETIEITQQAVEGD